MKTVCKKLLCLMLVAMMLVSAVPFAFADDTVEEQPITIKIRVDLDGETINDKKSKTLNPGEEWVLNEEFIRENGLISKWEGREYVGWASTNNSNATGLSYAWAKENVTEDYRLIINLTADDPDEEEQTPPADDPDEEEQTPPADDPDEEEQTPPPVVTDEIILSLWYNGGSNVKTITMVEGGKVPDLDNYDAPKKDGYSFDHWVSNKGVVLNEGMNWSSSFGLDFTPVYSEDRENDGLSALNVWVVYDVDGVTRDPYLLLTEYFDTTTKNNMFTWLYSNGGISDVREALAANGKNDGYEWDPVIYYNFFPESKKSGFAVTEADMTDDGAKHVCIKVDALEETKAQVYLYVHKSKTSTVSDIIEMKGFTVGDNVDLYDVKDVLKDNDYSYSAISSLYSQTDWEELLDGEETTGSASVNVNGNGTTKIHVILKNASVSSNADSSNPKTGDSITIAATTMVLAAAALVSVIELKKRKMI